MAEKNIAVELIKKGGKYVLEHPEKIAKFAMIAGQIFEKIAELREKYGNASAKAERYTQLIEENNIIQEKIIELESKVYELAEYYDNELVVLEKKNNELIAEVDTLKKELEAYKEENNVYKKKIQKILMFAGVLIGVGIIVAIILAIVI